MNQPNQNTLEAVKEFVQYMEQRRYSHNTIISYSESLKTFLCFLDNPPLASITNIDLERFNHEYIIANNYSESYQNQVINAVKLYFTKKQGMRIHLHEIERAKKSYRLPVVLSLDEVESLLNAVQNLKHRCMLSLIYSCGLRSGELINLRIADIDSKRMVIHIHQAKRKKDRVIPLSKSVLELF